MGGKLTGAGGGGFMLLFAPPEMQRVIRERFIQLIHVPFKIGFSGGQIIFFDSDEDNSGEEKDRAIRTIESFKKLTQTVI